MRAACTGIDPAIFHPEPDDADAIAAAKAICESCSILDDCRAASLDEKHGVWGGLTERERADLRRGPRPKSCGFCGGAFMSVRGARYCGPECRAANDHRRKMAWQHGERAADRIA